MPKKAFSGSVMSDALDILMEDHKKVRQIFTQFHDIKNQSGNDAKQMLVEIACTELVIHTQVEEELLYPALREVIDQTDLDLIDEAKVEHALAKQLISELESMHPEDDLYDAKFTVLGEYITHHIEEEQNKIFPIIKKGEMKLESLAQDILERREELRSEFGMPDEGYEENIDDENLQPLPAPISHHHH